MLNAFIVSVVMLSVVAPISQLLYFCTLCVDQMPVGEMVFDQEAWNMFA
jgi:hypothetical protein